MAAPSIYNGPLQSFPHRNKNPNPLEAFAEPHCTLFAPATKLFLTSFTVVCLLLKEIRGSARVYTAFPSFLVLQVSACSGAWSSQGQGLLYEVNNLSISSQGTTEQDNNLPFSPRPFPTSQRFSDITVRASVSFWIILCKGIAPSAAPWAGAHRCLHPILVLFYFL